MVDTQGVLLIISALTVAVVTILKAISDNHRNTVINTKLDESRDSATKREVKLDQIHTLTDGNLTEIKQQLIVANERISLLEGYLSSADLKKSKS